MHADPYCFNGPNFASIHTNIHTYIQRMHAGPRCSRCSNFACIHTYIHTYIHADTRYSRCPNFASIRTYIHTYIHTYMQTLAVVDPPNFASIQENLLSKVSYADLRSYLRWKVIKVYAKVSQTFMYGFTLCMHACMCTCVYICMRIFVHTLDGRSSRSMPRSVRLICMGLPCVCMHACVNVCIYVCGSSLIP
jgi:hypothetical protein